MLFWDRLIVGAIPVVPRAVVQRVARRYVAGESLEEALKTTELLEGQGAMATLDVLGEEVTEEGRAEETIEQYQRALDAIAQRGRKCNISIKLTALGLLIDEDLAERNLQRVAESARRHGNFVRIDMEDHTCTDATLRIYRSLQPKVGNLGVVLQAMLHRTGHDVAALAAAAGQGQLAGGLSVRLCKGIYREPASIAHQDRQLVREAFLAHLDGLLEGGAYVAIATHDDVLVKGALERIERLALGKQAYEFQMLLGVLPKLRRRLLDAGHRLRVYVPYGADWYAYSMRRLRENPEVARHVMKAMLTGQ